VLRCVIQRTSAAASEVICAPCSPEPHVQQVIITDAPAVLGLARFTELDERYAFSAMTATLRAVSAGTLQVEDPETLARLLLGALTRGGMLIANSPHPAQTRNTVARQCASCSPDSQQRRADVPTRRRRRTSSVDGCPGSVDTPRQSRHRCDRVTKRDQERLDRIRALRDPDHPAIVTHWLAAEAPLR